MADTKKRRRKGERADGRIAVYLDTGRTADGKRCRKTFYGKTRKEAESKRDAYKAKLTGGLAADADKVTVSQWSEMWFEAYKGDLRGKTLEMYNNQLKRLLRSVGYMAVKDVRNVHLQTALNEMEGMSKSAISKYVTVVRQLFNKAYQNRIIPYDPSVGLTIPAGTSGTHRALERWEVNHVICNWRAHRCGLWAMIMMLTGLRRGEMIALRWENVDMQNRTIHVCESAEIVGNIPNMRDTTKTAAGMRRIPICDPLYDVFNATPVEQRAGLVCRSASGGAITHSSFQSCWNTYNKAMERLLNDSVAATAPEYGTEMITSGVADGSDMKFRVRAHDLRFTFATALYDAGVDIKAAQYFLGHADVSMTMNIYTQLSREREIEARQKAVSFLDTWLEIGSGTAGLTRAVNGQSS